MTISEYLIEVSRHRERLQHFIMQATSLTHQIADEKNGYKVLEDAVIAEIWNNETYKNDKQRNEQKHLARINDDRLAEKQKYINLLEMQKADVHGLMLATQSDLTITLIQYEAAVKTTFTVPAVQFKLVAVETQQADTSKEIEVEPKLAHSVVDDISHVPADADYKPVSLRDTLAASMTPERKAELEAGAVEKPALGDDTSNVPYLKADTGKKPEKVGKIRI